MILNLNKSYYYIFIFIFFYLSELFENTLIWLLVSDQFNLEFIYNSWTEIIFLKGSLNLTFSLFCFFLHLALQLTFLRLKGFFLFESWWIKRFFFWLVVKIILVNAISYIILFNLFLPIEQSISNEIFSYSPSVIKFLSFLYYWVLINYFFFLIVPSKKKFFVFVLFWFLFFYSELIFLIILVFYLKTIIINDSKSN